MIPGEHTLWALMAQGDFDVAWDLCAEQEWFLPSGFVNTSSVRRDRPAFASVWPWVYGTLAGYRTRLEARVGLQLRSYACGGSKYFRRPWVVAV